MTVDGVVVRFKLDSGATCNVMPLEVYQRITALDRLDPGPRVRNYGTRGGYLKVLGTFTGSVVHRGEQFTVKFVVVDEPGKPPILGLPTCKRMELIKRVDAVTTERSSTLPSLVREFADIFSGIGKLAIEHDIK